MSGGSLLAVCFVWDEVQWRRFFTYTYGFEALDASWTAREIAGKYLKPRFQELLQRATEGKGNPEEDDLRRQTGIKGEDEAKAHVRKKREEHGNGLEVSQAVLEDRDYQMLGRQINAPMIPLRDEYLGSIEAFVRGRLATARWHARRSCSWRDTAMQIVKTLVDMDSLKECGIAERWSCPFPVQERARGHDGAAQPLVPFGFAQ